MAYVLIVDDHPFVAAATAREVAALMPGAETCCVDSVASAEAAIAKRAQTSELYPAGPLASGRRRTLGPCAAARTSRPNAIIAIVSGEVNPQVMRDAFSQGARGYLTKTRDVDEFTDSLKKFFERGFFFPPEARKAGATHSSFRPPASPTAKSRR